MEGRVIARNNYDAWIPEEWSGEVIQRVNQISAVESLARREPMSTETRHVPRSAGVDVDDIQKGGVYGEDTSANDEVLLTARKFGKAIRIADEDLKDISIVDLIAVKQKDWATSYAKKIDNACFAVTAGNDSGLSRAYDSVYYQLTQADTDLGYTANQNLTFSGSGGITYDNINLAWKLYEQSDYFDLTSTAVVAHSSFRSKFRGVKDGVGRPIFQDGAGSGIDTLFGAPIKWSNSLRTSGVDRVNPTGNPLMWVGNTDYLILGIRSGPESRVAGADSGAAFLTDEALLKMRARRGFNIGTQLAMSMLVDNSGL